MRSPHRQQDSSEDASRRGRRGEGTASRAARPWPIPAVVLGALFLLFIVAAVAVFLFREVMVTSLRDRVVEAVPQYCSADIKATYDALLPEGYTVQLVEDSFTLGSAGTDGIYPVTGRLEVVDAHARYAVDFQGAIRPSFLRNSFAFVGKPQLKCETPGQGAPTPPAETVFNAASLKGQFYQEDAPDNTLQLTVSGSQLAILLQHKGQTTLEATIPMPTGPQFAADGPYDRVSFLYSETSDTVSVTSSGATHVFVRGVAPAEPSESPSAAPGDLPCYYILPTNTQLITAADLYPFSQKEVRLIRNELYARYGYTFQTEEIRDYFLTQSWYTPDPEVNSATFTRDNMTETEQANLDTILQYETDMGWR